MPASITNLTRLETGGYDSILRRYNCSITASTTGVVSGTLQSTQGGGAASNYVFNGVMHGIWVTASTSAAPSANWDLTITTSDGADILAGAGSNLAAAEASIFVPVGVAAGSTAGERKRIGMVGTLTVTGTSMGDSKNARLTFILGSG